MAHMAPTPIPPVSASVLMMAFWTLLVGAAGIRIIQAFRTSSVLTSEK